VQQYMESIRRSADQTCMRRVESSVQLIDDLLSIPFVNSRLKSLFGVGGANLSDADFGALLTQPLSTVQDQVWDAAVGSTDFTRFCEALAAGRAGSKIGAVEISAVVHNYAKWIREVRI
jgi:nitrogen-specific signal transduction histidine kinase